MYKDANCSSHSFTSESFARGSYFILTMIVGLLGLVISLRSATADEFQVAFAELYIDENGIEHIIRNWSQGALQQQFAQASFIEIEPSVTSSTLGAELRTSNNIFFCINTQTGEIIPDCDIVVTLNDVSDDGGHVHQANRPLGEWNPPFGNSGSDGMLRATYTSPEVSGVINFRAQGTLSSGVLAAPFDDTIFVRIPGLSEFVAGANYNLIGQTATHPDNHYGSTMLIPALVTIANKYAAMFPGSKIEYNDMSLQFGGLFDIFAAWQPPHKSHRFGDDVDVRLVPNSQRRALRQIISGAGVQTNLNEGNHWHLRQ